MTLGEVIRAYRKSHAMTLEEFGKRASLSKGYISMIENGKNSRTGQPITPTIETYKHLAQAMGITMAELTARMKEEEASSRFDPVSALFDDLGVRTVARKEMEGATPQEVDEKKAMLKKMIRYMFSKEE